MNVPDAASNDSNASTTTTTTTTTTTSSGATRHSIAKGEAMCVDVEAEHQQQYVARACTASCRLLGRIAATLHLTTAIPDAGQRAAGQTSSLAAGHAALDLLASLNTSNSPQQTLDDAANLAFFAARILWFEADVGEQHDFAADILDLLELDAFPYNEDGCFVDKLNYAAIELVLAAAEHGVMLQGPLSSADTHRQTAVHFWTTWLLRSAEHLEALFDEHEQSRRRTSQVLHLITAACTQLKRLLSANDAGNASYTSWQADTIIICGEAAVCLGTNVCSDYADVGIVYGSGVEVVAARKYLRIDMFAMMKAGILGTFPEVARWLLLRCWVVGSEATSHASESDSPVVFSKIKPLLLELASLSGVLGRCVVASVSKDPHTPLCRPPQQEVSNGIVRVSLAEMVSRYTKSFLTLCIPASTHDIQEAPQSS